MIIIAWFTRSFVNVIGIDPGDKTWLAGVRQNIQSGVEVSVMNQAKNILYLYFVYAFMLFLHHFNYRLSLRFHHVVTIKERSRKREREENRLIVSRIHR